MNLTVSYRHLESSPALEEKITTKVKHLEKHLHDDFTVKWVCSVSGHVHTSDVNISSKSGVFHAKAEDNNMYKTLDVCMTKIEKQITKKTEKIKGH